MTMAHTITPITIIPTIRVPQPARPTNPRNPRIVPPALVRAVTVRVSTESMTVLSASSSLKPLFPWPWSRWKQAASESNPVRC